MATGNDGMPDLARVGDERTVEQVVAARLRRSILDGALAPGAQLRYRQLADQFGVSVTPVRVALKELAGEGLVELRPHAGASVSALSVEELEEVLLTRASLEPFLALHGTARLTDGDVAEMAGRLDEVREVTRALDRDGYLDASLGAAVDRLPGRRTPAAARARRHALRPLASLPRGRAWPTPIGSPGRWRTWRSSTAHASHATASRRRRRCARGSSGRSRTSSRRSSGGAPYRPGWP